jgi:TM2 domain-containing membrane protein YozV
MEVSKLSKCKAVEMNYDDILQKIEKISDLKDKGLLTEEEFNEQKSLLFAAIKQLDPIEGANLKIKNHPAELLINTKEPNQYGLMSLDPNMTAIELRIQNEKKNLWVAYILWLIFGVAGIHNFYLTDFRRGYLEIGFSTLTAFLLFCAIGGTLEDQTRINIIYTAIASGLCVAWLYISDLWNIPKLCNDYSSALREKYIKEYEGKMGR